MTLKLIRFSLYLGVFVFLLFNAVSELFRNNRINENEIPLTCFNNKTHFSNHTLCLIEIKQICSKYSFNTMVRNCQNYWVLTYLENFKNK
jgi:hypothetical protein